MLFERLYARWVLGVRAWRDEEVDVYRGIDTSMWRRKKRGVNTSLPSLASSTDFMLNGISMDGLGLGFPLGWMGRVSERSYASNHIDRFFMSPDGRVYRSFVSISYDYPEIIVDRDKFKVWEKQYLKGGAKYVERALPPPVEEEEEDPATAQEELRKQQVDDLPNDPSVMHPAWFVPKAGSTFVKQDDKNLVAAFEPAAVSPSMHGYRIRPDVTKNLKLEDIYEFEGVLFLLRRSDPEDWSVKERIKVLSFLCDFVIETKQFETFVRPEQGGVAELEREDAKAGAEVDACFSFGGDPRGESEHKAFSAWKKAAGAKPVTAGEGFFCPFCKSGGPSGPAAARSPSGDSWVSCPVIMASEAPPSFDGFSGSQLYEVEDDCSSVLRVKEASRVAATKAAIAANRTEPCHESCLRSVWRGRRISRAQELAMERAGGDVGKWTSRSLGRDRAGGQYFLLSDELCRRSGESWR